MLKGRGAAFLLAAQLALAGIAGAEVRIAGDLEAMDVSAENASVAEVLAALAETFDLRFSGSTALDQPVTGSLRGPLAEVLAQLLEDFDFVARRVESGEIEIVYLRQSAGSGGAQPAVAPSAATLAPVPARDAAREPPPPQWRISRKTVRPPKRIISGFGPGGFRCHRRPDACQGKAGQ